MSDTIQSKITSLENALSRGALSVKIDGQEVTYRSTSALIQALNYFKSQQQKATGKSSLKVSVGAYEG